VALTICADPYVVAKGFNTVVVSIVEHLFSRQAPRDRAGNEPFTTSGDMSTPNDVYFDHAELFEGVVAAPGLAPLYRRAAAAIEAAAPARAANALAELAALQERGLLEAAG